MGAWSARRNHPSRTPDCILSPIAAASIAADQNASVDTAYFDMDADGAAVCIFTYIETKAALGTSTLWAKATIRGPLTW
jgi:hypothetical protein